MPTRRVIVCLDVKGGRVVKGVQFQGLRDVGDPVELAARYEAAGADEITFLDISATEEERQMLWDVVRRTAERLFIPLTVGGGVRTVEDVGRALRAGADKVSINSASVARPELLTECAERFGAQCVVASIDAKRVQGAASSPRAESGDAVAQTGPGGASGAEPRWTVFTHGGKRDTGKEAIAWARECVRRGAGEVLLTSIDRDGARSGYDLALTSRVAAEVSVPVIASGGAGSAEHLRAALQEGGADAALVAGILHDGVTTVGALKSALAAAGVPVRRVG